MFTYLHCYLPETWAAQERAGLINANAGIRFCQSIDIEEHLKFNRLAARDGELFALLREREMPFYIDRLQGGCFIEDYPYDMELVRSIRSMLGDKFWGFQMHEWMSNYLSDLGKLQNGGCSEWTAEAIRETIFRLFPFKNLFLESMNAEEMAQFGRPDSLEEFTANSEALFARRQRYTDGMVLPCDSGFLAFPLELAHGAKRVMAEIGAQTPHTRVQLAFARGMTRAYRVPFGSYYEPWGGSPFSACCYQRDNKNEWNIGSASDFPFQTCGENGGSSRSMQRRMHLCSYFAGASFMAEEWGMCNTFYDWHNFELSPYGMVKRDFLRFTEKYPDIGTPVTPIAVVLPKELRALSVGELGSDADMWLGSTIDGHFARQIRAMRAGIRELFCTSGDMLGTEAWSLLNCTVPDTLDLVTEDCVRPEDYDYFVDLTGSPAFAAAHPEKCVAPGEVRALLNRLLPCSITDGEALMQLTDAGNGAFYLLLTNNSGVVRTVEHGEQLMPEAEAHLTLACAPGKQLIPLEGDASLRTDGEKIHISIPAGGFFMGRLA